MRLIVKREPPQFLLSKQYEAARRGLNAAEAYRLLNHRDKQRLLESLLREQGHLCAYCMRRLPDEREMPENIDPVTIEHWLPRNPSDGVQNGQGLDYFNLLAVCSGNRGRRGTRRIGDLTCDARRAPDHEQLTLNPCVAATLEHIKYREDGIMYSDDPDIHDDITVKLNLNCNSAAVQLPEVRRMVLEAMQAEIPDSPEEAEQFCREVLDMYSAEADPRTEYSGILIWWLKDFLRE